MAEGGEDIEMVDPLPRLSNEDWVGLNRIITGDDENTQYSIGDNLSTDTRFTTPIRPRPETVEPFSTPGRPLAGGTLVGLELNYALVADKLKDALEGTGWTFTNTGLNKLAQRIHSEGDKLFYIPEKMGN